MPDSTHVEFDAPEPKAKGGERKLRRTPQQRIARLPQNPRIDPAEVHSADQRSIAAAKMRLAGAPFHEIADELGYESAEKARVAYISALASMHPMEDLETLRQSAALRADILFRQSLAMASADYLLVTEIAKDEETGEEVEIEVQVPNADRLRWHDQAAKDLALHAAITGAKAPARMEINASTEEINRIVHPIATHEGGEDLEADIFEIAQIEAIDAEIVEED